MAIAVDQISAVTGVIERLRWDPSFRRQYCENPDVALGQYDLSPAEARALKSGDGLQFEALGLGQKWCEFIEVVCGPHPGP